MEPRRTRLRLEALESRLTPTAGDCFGPWGTLLQLGLQDATLIPLAAGQPTPTPPPTPAPTPTPTPTPEVRTKPPFFDHIRVAELGYNGNPWGATETKLLQTAVDLVITEADPRDVPKPEAANPDVPNLIYANASNLYGESLADWANAADFYDVSRETAFYHVAAETAYTGGSPSSHPVTWFDNVTVGPTDSDAVQNLTSQAHDTTTADVELPTTGRELVIGKIDPFREVRTLGAGASANVVVQYVAATDADGNPTQWNTLAGKVFDPPSDWKPAFLPGNDAALYYVRLHTTGPATTLDRVLGRDYTGAGDSEAGIIPAFDSTADVNGDNYLTDSELGNARTGFTARFAYESRLFYPYYGASRYVLNPADANVQAWSADYMKFLLSKFPTAEGLFLDNSSGRNPVDGLNVIESSVNYTADYVKLLQTIRTALPGKQIIGNTSPGGVAASAAVQGALTGTLEEFAIRPKRATWEHVDGLAADVAARRQANPTGTIILDALSQGGSPTDPGTQIGALAYYYLLADPVHTYFLPFGGEEPASSWSRHFFGAITFDVGQPQGAMQTFADVTNAQGRTKAYVRAYENAIVLYEPNGTNGTGSPTSYTPTGAYRVLNADGTLGERRTGAYTLTPGSGAVLVRTA